MTKISITGLKELHAEAAAKFTFVVITVLFFLAGLAMLFASIFCKAGFPLGVLGGIALAVSFVMADCWLNISIKINVKAKF